MGGEVWNRVFGLFYVTPYPFLWSKKLRGADPAGGWLLRSYSATGTPDSPSSPNRNWFLKNNADLQRTGS